MPTFDTRGPITVTVSVVAGDIRIVASDRSDTVVDVRPSDPSAAADVRAAEQTRVEFADGRLLVKAPKQRGLGLFGMPGYVDVTIALPAGSQLRGDAAVAAFHGSGSLGDCRIRTAAADVELDHTAELDVQTAAGAVLIGTVTGSAQVSTASGTVRLAEVAGAATVKSASGDTWIGSVGGDVRVGTANGDITVEHALRRVSAATAMGSIRLGEVVQGPVSAKTAFGTVEVGVRPGVAAWLDAQTGFGGVINRMTVSEVPSERAETVEITARTSYGDIVIHHADVAESVR